MLEATYRLAVVHLVRYHGVHGQRHRGFRANPDWKYGYFPFDRHNISFIISIAESNMSTCSEPEAFGLMTLTSSCATTAARILLPRHAGMELLYFVASGVDGTPEYRRFRADPTHPRPKDADWSSFGAFLSSIAVVVAVLPRALPARCGSHYAPL